MSTQRKEDMKAILRGLLVLAVGMGLAVAIAMGQKLSELSADDAKIVKYWLLQDCSLGEKPGLESQLRAKASVIKAALLDAATAGPDADTLKDVEKAANQRYEQRGAALARQETATTADQAVLAAAQKQTQADFVATEKANFVVRYKAQAVTGLAAIGARAELEAIAKNKQSEMSENAKLALQAMGEKKR